MGWFLQGHLEFLDKEILDGRLTWSVIGIQPQVYFSTVSRNKLDLSFLMSLYCSASLSVPLACKCLFS